MKIVFTILTVALFTSGLCAQSPQKMSYQTVIRNSSNQLVANHAVGMQISILKGSETGTAVFVERHSPTTNTNGLATIVIGTGTLVSGSFSTIDWGDGIYFIKTETDPAGGTSYTITGTSQLLSVPYALYAKTTDGLADKVDKVIGKGLSTNDYTTAEQTKLAGIATGAEVNVQADWNEATNTADDYIKNKPTIPAAQVQANWTATTGMGVLLNKPANIDEDKTDDVTLTGNQTIAGNKTFTGTTTVPAPVNSTDAATKAYVDALINQLSSKGVIAVDADNNIYSTVRIGPQVWMAENLKTTKYSDGTAIPLVTGNSNWEALTSTSKAYCWYNNDISNKEMYGALYTWSAAMNGSASSTANPSDVQGVCPTGWHLPSDTEWGQLIDYLGGSSVAGGKLKETGTTFWNSPNEGATNETGFTALPGGHREGDGNFDLIGNFGRWWSATELNAGSAWGRSVVYYINISGRDDASEDFGFSVRCLRD